jgi:hypothetical protein
VTLYVDGIGHLGSWQTRKGGETTVNPATFREGGMGPLRTIAALPTYTDLTLTRVYTKADVETCADLIQQSGRVQCSVTEQPLDEEGNAFGAPRVYRGRVTSVKPGDYDANSDVARMWEIDVKVTTISN